jgi:hypothetical protein
MGQALAPAVAADRAALSGGAPMGDAARDDALVGPDAIPGLWRGNDLARVRPGFATGYAPLDAELPGGGWPAGALIEVWHRSAGIGEVRLFFPALAALTRAGSPVFLLAPPWQPYAPALANAGIALPRVTVVRPARPQDLLWAGEQILKTLRDGALLAWPGALKARDARRWQLAAEGKAVLAVLLRPAAAAPEATPAALRIALAAERGRLWLSILKRRGGPLARPIAVAPSGVPFAPAPLAETTPVPHAPYAPHALDRDPLPRPDPRHARAGAHA